MHKDLDPVEIYVAIARIEEKVSNLIYVVDEIKEKMEKGENKCSVCVKEMDSKYVSVSKFNTFYNMVSWVGGAAVIAFLGSIINHVIRG